MTHVQLATIGLAATITVIVALIARPASAPQKQVEVIHSALERKPVPTVRIVQDNPPSQIQLPKPESGLPPTPINSSYLSPKKSARVVASNVCTRHKLQKVYSNGGRSWRCRK
jgi:hypothetical protein